VGLIVLAAGFGVISGAAWARWLGIIFVSIQALTNFLFIPAQPFWAIILILIDLWIIHSLFVHRREPDITIDAAELAAFANLCCVCPFGR
jgi:hypothetical protein